ncbi:MAG: hypothetical protein IJF15_06595 [Oscillospiraceae bacterium]|nr:hypothetical protein [Oscillospiraceae bacterium]
METKNRWIMRLVALLTIGFTLTSLVAIAAETGSSSDPLVTLSYLSEVYMDELLARVDEKIAARNEKVMDDLSGKIADAAGKAPQGGTSEVPSGGTTGGTANTQSFTLVDLTQGQTLRLPIGSEVLLRVGTASCVADSTPGLIDTTDAATLSGGGALVKNHLYMVTMENRAVKATAETVKVLVRGAYTVE